MYTCRCIHWSISSHILLMSLSQMMIPPEFVARLLGADRIPGFDSRSPARRLPPDRSVRWISNDDWISPGGGGGSLGFTSYFGWKFWRFWHFRPFLDQMILFVVGHLPLGAGKNCRFLNRANDALIEPFLCKISCDWETWQNILFAQLLNPTNDLNTKGVRYFARLSLLRQLLFGTEDLQRLTKSLQNRCSVHRSHTQSKKIRCRKGGGEVMGKGKAPCLLVKMKLRGCEGFSDFLARTLWS